MKRITMFAGAIALIIPSCLVTGCVGKETTCLPESLTASSQTVKAGSNVTISAPPAACDLQGCCVLESDLDHREDGLDQLVLGMQRA
ncbi:hypothetical protein, partial [Paeniglutamicibacter psychrophenolicus]|uniref:hypothetical protein n=1 Tax=Paeniglutamicibacter psychrophenolicus TaxID=257454 RepID=UPI0031D473BC